jgi:hypothetical protein
MPSSQRTGTLLLAQRSALLAFAVLFVRGYLDAQPAPVETSDVAGSEQIKDEVIVRGKRSLFDLRGELQEARTRIWDIFNEINSNDDFDISCVDAPRTGSRLPRRVCRPKYANDGTSQVGKDLAGRIQRNCNPQSEWFGQCLEQAFQFSGAEGSATIGRLDVLDKRLDEELQKLAHTNSDLANAILDYQSKEREYQDARRERKE